MGEQQTHTQYNCPLSLYCSRSLFKVYKYNVTEFKTNKAANSEHANQYFLSNSRVYCFKIDFTCAIEFLHFFISHSDNGGFSTVKIDVVIFVICI